MAFGITVELDRLAFWPLALSEVDQSLDSNGAAAFPQGIGAELATSIPPRPAPRPTPIHHNPPNRFERLGTPRASDDPDRDALGRLGVKPSAARGERSTGGALHGGAIDRAAVELRLNLLRAGSREAALRFDRDVGARHGGQGERGAGRQARDQGRDSGVSPHGMASSIVRFDPPASREHAEGSHKTRVDRYDYRGIAAEMRLSCVSG